MTRLYLVRHGRAAAKFGEADDPGLDETGRSQAEAVAKRLAPLGSLGLRTSPLKRARETSEPLARRWLRDAIVEPAVAEIPQPAGMDLAQRADWLRGFMRGSWRNAPREYAQWREDLLAVLGALQDDTVVFSHFVAINVATGFAEGDDRVAIFRPDNGSVTILDADSGTLRLVARGNEGETKVN